MAKMIPNDIEKSSSNAEKKVYELLKKLPDEYIVLHSLELKNHIKKIKGEIDFLIICKYGILCLEVKGGRVERQDGIWIFEDREGNKNQKIEGPYEQASGNMFSLIEYLKTKLGKDDNILKTQYAYAVTFPDIEKFNQDGPDIELQITIDKTKIEENSIESLIKNIYKYHQNKHIEKYGLNKRELSKQDISKLVTYLRGNFGFVPTMSSILENTNEKLVKLTKEQSDVLNMMSTNDRILIEGAGGTGKTLLLYERAIQEALEGKKVLFICYNKVLSLYLNQKLKSEEQSVIENIRIVNFHSLLTEKIQKENNQFAFRDDNEFFQKDLPKEFIKYDYEQYDVLVIDEAQDLLRLNYFDCFDKILKNKFKNGRWFIALDKNQNIYNEELEETINLIKEEIRPATVKLTKNCRNSKQISIENKMLTTISQGIDNEVDGEAVEVIKYENEQQQKEYIKKIVIRLKNNGIDLKDIAILSKYNFDNSIFKGENFLKEKAGIQIINGHYETDFSENKIKFSTIHSFKGLESKIIILADIDKFEGKEINLLNYVAISRAKLLLYILYDAKCEDEYNNMLQQYIDKILTEE